jgi:hypothetical protein
VELTERERQLLFENGFKLKTSAGVHRVPGPDVLEVEASAGGFKVYYAADPALPYLATTVEVHRIDFPNDLTRHWIVVECRAVRHAEKLKPQEGIPHVTPKHSRNRQ